MTTCCANQPRISDEQSTVSDPNRSQSFQADSKDFGKLVRKKKSKKKSSSKPSIYTSEGAQEFLEVNETKSDIEKELPDPINLLRLKNQRRIDAPEVTAYTQSDYDMTKRRRQQHKIQRQQVQSSTPDFEADY